MKLSDLLLDDWVALPLEATDLSEALEGLVRLLLAGGSMSEAEGRSLTADLLEAGRKVVRVNDEIVLVPGTCEALQDASVLLGISPKPFEVVDAAEDGPGTARALILLLTPSRLDLLRERLIPTLVRALRDEERTARLLAAGSAMEIRAFKELMQVELRDRLLVEDALTPIRYHGARGTTRCGICFQACTDSAQRFDFTLKNSHGVRSSPLRPREWKIFGHGSGTGCRIESVSVGGTSRSP
jgi:hypothetical protein